MSSPTTKFSTGCLEVSTPIGEKSEEMYSCSTRSVTAPGTNGENVAFCATACLVSSSVAVVPLDCYSHQQYTCRSPGGKRTFSVSLGHGINIFLLTSSGHKRGIVATAYRFHWKIAFLGLYFGVVDTIRFANTLKQRE